MSLSYTIDFSKTDGVIKPLHGANLGPITVNGFIDLTESFKEIDFPFIRLHDCPYAVPDTVDIHCIFPNFHADENDERNYNFKTTDDYIQSLIDIGSRIVYRLGETIEHYSRSKYYVNPPEDFEKWARICSNIIRHYNDGWAEGFYHNIKYWEIWNEPWNQPACWTGSNQDYFELYVTTAKILKSDFPQISIGGASSSHGVSTDFAKDFLDFCKDKKAPLDFYAWHIYSNSIKEVLKHTNETRKYLDEKGFKNTESHLNEWNYNNFGFIWEPGKEKMIRQGFREIQGPKGAAFDVCVLSAMQKAPIDIMNFYWAKEGLWGMYDLYGVKQKNFFAFKAFRSMLDTPLKIKIDTDADSFDHTILAGKSKDNVKAQILLSNFESPEEQFELQIENLPWKGRTVYKAFLIDENNELTQHKEFVFESNIVLHKESIKAPGIMRIELEKFKS